MASADKRPQIRTGWKRWLPRDLWQVLLAPLILLAAGAGITYLSRDKEEPNRPTLRALAPTVTNGPDKAEATHTASGEDASRQTEAAKPRVDVRLHNVGTQRAVLTSARFVVKRAVRIPACGVGAGLIESGKYDVMLPSHPTPGAVVEVPINQ